MVQLHAHNFMFSVNVTGDIVLSSSKVDVISPLDLVAGDYLLFSVTFYDRHGNLVGSNNTGQLVPNSWIWLWGFTGTSVIGVTSLNHQGLTTVATVENHGRLMLSTQTGKAGNYGLFLGAGNDVPQGTPVQFIVTAGKNCEFSDYVVLANMHFTQFFNCL